MASQQYHYYKIILIGDAGVGKTTLFNRIKTGKFIQSTQVTVGTQRADEYLHRTVIGDDSLNVTLRDTAGGERFRAVSDSFYRDADGAMLVYSVNDLYTFENLKDWVDDAKPFINQNTFGWALIGNKCDLDNNVGEQRAEVYLQELKAKVSYEVSAKTGNNVMQAFNDFIHTIHKHYTAKQITSSVRPQGSVIKIDTIDTASGKQRNRHCCS